MRAWYDDESSQEKMVREQGAVGTRVASSFLRFGQFEIFHQRGATRGSGGGGTLLTSPTSTPSVSSASTTASSPQVPGFALGLGKNGTGDEGPAKLPLHGNHNSYFEAGADGAEGCEVSGTLKLQRVRPPMHLPRSPALCRAWTTRPSR